MSSSGSADGLIRQRRQVSVVLVLALGVSVVSNIAAADPSWLARAVSAWPPIALLLAVDVVSRSPRPTGWLGRLTLAATLVVASVAATASFSHMKAVALEAGESGLVAVLFPLTVDGLAVVCSASLVEIARRVRVVEPVGERSGDLRPDVTGGGLGLSAASTGVASSVVGVPVGAAVDRQPVVLLTRNGSSPS